MAPTCSGCGGPRAPGWVVFCDHCQENRPQKLPWPRYLLALRRFRAMIADGAVALTGFDCNATGQKSTEVSWGLCSTSRKQWPDAEDHIWPHSFRTEGRSAPLSQDDHQLCPFDSQEGVDDGRTWGCFYRCAFFHDDQMEKHPHLNSLSQEAVLARYGELIASTEARIAEDSP